MELLFTCLSDKKKRDFSSTEINTLPTIQKHDSYLLLIETLFTLCAFDQGKRGIQFSIFTADGGVGVDGCKKFGVPIWY